VANEKRSGWWPSKNNYAQILEVQEKNENEKKSLENSLLKHENRSKAQTIRYQRIVTPVISIMLAGGLAFVDLLIHSRCKIRNNADILAKLNQEKKHRTSNFKI